jgi:hypothetical protein
MMAAMETGAAVDEGELGPRAGSEEVDGTAH